MNDMDNGLKSVLSTILKQKRIHGLFNLEGIFAVISRLESIDVVYEKKNKISRNELNNTLKFAVIAFVVLPILPDKKYSFSSLFSRSSIRLAAWRGSINMAHGPLEKQVF